MAYPAALTHKVSNRGCPRDSFLNELVNWGRTAADDIFAPRAGHSDIYVSVVHELGPYTDLRHRRAVMLEVLRVLAGFETSWDWNHGVDITNHRSMHHAKSQEAGVFQVSFDSLKHRQDLLNVVTQKAGAEATTDPIVFDQAMRRNHILAMEYVARLLRHSIAHHGPILNRHIHPWLRRDAVQAFLGLLYPSIILPVPFANGRFQMFGAGRCW